MNIVFQRSEYNQHLTDICQHALLNLYLITSETSRFTPLAKRNDILRRYLKPQLNLESNKSVKKEMKRILVITKKGNAEKCLNDLLSELIITDAKQASINKCVHFLAALHESLDIDVALAEKNESAAMDYVYMLKEHLFNHIDNNGNMIKPVSLLLYTDRVTEIVEYIKKEGQFDSEICYQSQCGKEAHILLS